MNQRGAGRSMDRRMMALDGAFTPGRFVMAMVVVVAGLFPDVLSGGASFFYRDFGLFGYPLAMVHQRAFWDGQVPLWNPYSSCGMPFMAQWNTMVFYPGSLIYLLLPLPWSLNLFCLAHLVLAGLGMYVLAHAWTRVRLAASVAGFAYAFNGLMLHCLMWPNNIAALAWMPLVIWTVERAWRRGGRWVYGAALAGATQFLAGGPEVILFTWAILGGWWLVHQGWRLRSAGSMAVLLKQGTVRLVAVGCMVGGLTCVQALPFARFLAASHRDTHFGDSVWAMPGWGWANFLVPLFHATPSLAGVYSQDDQQWTSSYYVGIGVLALGILALLTSQARLRPRVCFLGAVFLGGLVLTLGDDGYLYAWIKSVFPAMGFARFPVKFVVLCVWALPLLAAFGVRSLVRCGPAVAASALRVVVCIAATLLVLIGFLVWFAWAYPFPGEDAGSTLASGLSRAGILVAYVFLLAGLSRRRLGPVYLALAGLTCALVVLDGVTHTPRQNPTVSAQALVPRPVTEHALPLLGEGRAMLSPHVRGVMTRAGHPDPKQHTWGYRRVVCPNWNLIDEVPLVDSFFSLYPRHWNDVLTRLYEDPEGPPGPLADFLGVSQVTSDQELFAWEGRDSALPMVTGGQQPVFLEEARILEQLSSPGFRPRLEALFSEASRDAMLGVGSAEVEILSTLHLANELEVVARSSEPSILVLAQTHDPGWRARVGDQSVEVLRVNHAFQAVRVPAGQSTIRLTYRDTSYEAGRFVSGAFWGVCLWMGRPRRWCKRHAI